MPVTVVLLSILDIIAFIVHLSIFTITASQVGLDASSSSALCSVFPNAWRSGTSYSFLSAFICLYHLLLFDIYLFLCCKFVHWEKGRHVFERLLIDSDWAINNGNWLWLSCSSFFYQVQFSIPSLSVAICFSSAEINN